MSRSPWLEGKEPPVPIAFRPWMCEPRAVVSAAPSEPSPEALAQAAKSALGRSLHPTGRERGGAFDLLAADGMVTYACEAIVMKFPAPLPALRTLVQGLVRLRTPVE